ncbi:transposon Tf2-6 polyprotein [Trichonephila clavipes]|nr:transposon Tf2-6 polyprotein [Trichonephila clavipes]
MNLAVEQKKDQDLEKLKLLSNSSKNEEFRFIDGILCRKNFDPDGKLWLPVIPKHLRADILRHMTPPPQESWFCENMTGLRRESKCRSVCHALSGVPKEKIRSSTTTWTFSSHPSSYSSLYIAFELISLGDFQTEVDEIAKFLLEEIVLRHGAPRVIIKIVEPSFDPDLFPLSSTCSRKNWDEILPFVTFAYNTAKQETTGFTPFYLLHGREAETTLDTMLPFCPNDFDDNNITKIAARAEESRQLARVHTLRAQDKDRRRYDSKHQMVSYAPGDLVWVYTPVKSRSLRKTLKKVLDESRSFFRVHTGYFSNIPKCIKAEFIASWACSQSSVVSSSQR